jgi:hypothetical protein
LAALMADKSAKAEAENIKPQMINKNLKQSKTHFCAHRTKVKIPMFKPN